VATAYNGLCPRTRARDGPLSVLGGIPVETVDGFTYEVRNRQLLCRCGASANKPFCDGSHQRVKFKAP
jgi:CDGSH-type Zn-finger protein